jgi:choline-glycine betaine transporter
MNKMFKVISLVLVLVVCFSLPVLAVDPGNFSGNTSGTEGLANLGNTIIGVLQVVATIVAIAVLLFVGIKFLLASPSEKANIKGMLIPYLIGAIIIFATVPILQIIKGFTAGIQ